MMFATASSDLVSAVSLHELPYEPHEERLQQPAQHAPRALDIRDPARCAYPSKPCANLRVLKRNGQLHRFCDHHRAIANRNQQRLQQRKKAQRRTTLRRVRRQEQQTHLCQGQRQQQQTPRRDMEQLRQLAQQEQQPQLHRLQYEGAVAADTTPRQLQTRTPVGGCPRRREPLRHEQCARVCSGSASKHTLQCLNGYSYSSSLSSLSSHAGFGSHSTDSVDLVDADMRALEALVVTDDWRLSVFHVGNVESEGMADGGDDDASLQMLLQTAFSRDEVAFWHQSPQSLERVV